MWRALQDPFQNVIAGRFAVKKKLTSIPSHRRESTQSFTLASHRRFHITMFYVHSVQRSNFLQQALQDKHKEVKAVGLVMSALEHAPTWVHDIFLLCVIVRFFNLFTIGDLESDHIIWHVSQSANTANMRLAVMKSLFGWNQQLQASWPGQEVQSY